MTDHSHNEARAKLLADYLLGRTERFDSDCLDCLYAIADYLVVPSSPLLLQFDRVRVASAKRAVNTAIERIEEARPMTDEPADLDTALVDNAALRARLERRR